jgi:hypothetical protein
MKKGAICCTEEETMEPTSEKDGQNEKFGQCGDEDVEGDGCDCDCWN